MKKYFRGCKQDGVCLNPSGDSLPCLNSPPLH